MKLLFIVGTRPEAIKLAPVVHLAKKKELFDVVVCSTGQHKEMLGQTCQILGLECDIDLGIMDSGASNLCDVAAGVLSKTNQVIADENPDWIIVQGDTASAFAGGLAGYYNHVKVVHVEAGLRSFDNQHPFPEEVNRRLIGTFADIHCAPTEDSRQNLINENIDGKTITTTGNTVIDALKIVKERINNSKELQKKLQKDLPFVDDSKKLILVTSHRRENHGSGLRGICEAIKELAEQRPDIQVIFPVHLNPNVKKVVYGILENITNVVLTDPLHYLSIIYLLNKSYLIITDSGGIQEEASAFSTPVLVLRQKTERMEGVNAGIAKLVGADKNLIIKEAINLLDNEDDYIKMCRDISPYGDGLASQRILDEIMVRS